jgi:4-hydroxy-tetrahydrodipicolinate synthase
MLSGSIVAIVTPMTADGALDLPGLKKLIEWHIAEGTDGIVIVGTTGESPTVDVDEHQRLIEAAIEYAAKRVPVIAGTGGNSTKEPRKRSRSRSSPGRPGPTMRSPWCRTTTSPRRKGSSGISRRSRNPPTSR